ncbi:EpsG family protein [Sphingomonas sp. RIT328]|uniref:EpsG family protein n=1 Tax=Sphingomonas sp. RIT328 TaxID=1470591 RepID=UPI0004493D30|nr:EpsG family protein [Sphingomonas sp. RIT328]EZP55117.1 hypothetical protein BW41_01129 [Sphingomonas sp. RIT328]
MQSSSENVSGTVLHWIILIVIGITIGCLSINTKPDRFADFDTYVLYVDQLVHFPPDNWYFFEAFSNYWLLSLHWLVQSIYGAVVVAHYALGATFLFFAALTFAADDSSWKSTLFTFALLGPALAFVTLRATPAYFLVALAVRHAMKDERRAWLYMFAALMFHASTVLAIGPFMLLYFRDQLPTAFRADKPAKMFIVLVSLLVIVSVIAPQISNGIISIIKSVPFFEKYIAYTEEGQANDYVTSINHYIFLAFTAIFTGGFFIFSPAKNKKLNVYLLSSFSIYFGLFFIASPVAAFRQTPFWLIPMIVIYPWERVGVRSIGTPIFVCLCAGLLYFQFGQVYL